MVQHQETVVMLHSSASSARQWQPLVEQLAPRMRCLPVELYGHGAQHDWRGPSMLTLADEAALVEEALEHQGGPVHVVGHSYGAAVALKFVARNPGRVRSVVAYEPVLFRLLIDDPRSQREAQEALALGDGVRVPLAHGRALEAAEFFVGYWSGAQAWQSLPAARREAFASRMHSVLWHFEALYGEPLGLAQLARLRVPMLFLTGERSTPIARRIGELLRAGLPSSRHELLPGLGHMGPITHAASVNPLIAQFVHGSFAAHHPSTLRPQGTFAATQP
jgi:pimeloyl-ACP methyl ester carboxylesterase